MTISFQKERGSIWLGIAVLLIIVIFFGFFVTVVATVARRPPPPPHDDEEDQIVSASLSWPGSPMILAQSVPMPRADGITNDFKIFFCRVNLRWGADTNAAVSIWRTSDFVQWTPLNYVRFGEHSFTNSIEEDEFGVCHTNLLSTLEFADDFAPSGRAFYIGVGAGVLP